MKELIPQIQKNVTPEISERAQQEKEQERAPLSLQGTLPDLPEVTTSWK